MSDAFDPRATVYLPPAAAAAIPAQLADRGAVEAVSFTANAVSARTRTDAPALLTIAQSHAPGWQATIDGAPAPILRANHAFQAVLLPAGEHAVRLRYRGRFFRLGLAVAGIAAIITLFLWRKNAATPASDPRSEPPIDSAAHG